MIRGYCHTRIEYCTSIDSSATSFLEPLRGRSIAHGWVCYNTEGGESVSRSSDRLLVQSIMLLIFRHYHIIIHVTLGAHEVIRGRIDRCRLHLSHLHLIMLDRNLLLSLLLWLEDATDLIILRLMQTMAVPSGSSGLNMMLID